MRFALCIRRDVSARTGLPSDGKWGGAIRAHTITLLSLCGHCAAHLGQWLCLGRTCSKRTLLACATSYLPGSGTSSADLDSLPLNVLDRKIHPPSGPLGSVLSEEAATYRRQGNVKQRRLCDMNTHGF